MSKDIILSVKNLHKSFKKTEVLKGVNLEVKRGEVIALVGKNGSGKTVLLETIFGLYEKKLGEVDFDPNTKFEKADEIGFGFQDSKMDYGIKPKNLIKLSKELYSHRIDEAEYEKQLKTFKIDKILNKNISKLSGGQRQRMNLFLALIHTPQILVLDEFVTGLDIITMMEILKYVKELQKRKNLTLIIITHQPEELRMLSDRIAILKDGVIDNIYETKSIKKPFTEFLTEVLSE